MAYFPQPHTTRRARRYRVNETLPVVFIYGERRQSQGRLIEISNTGGSADMEAPLPGSTLVHLTVRTTGGQIAAVAEMLPPLTAKRQGFRFIALDEEDGDSLQRFVGRSA